eukprot:scaffold5358_cov68-Phaeocystis_antarctica.AAC.2
MGGRMKVGEENFEPIDPFPSRLTRRAGSAALTGDLLWAARGRASAEACGPGSTKLCDTWDFERAPHVDELCACRRRGTLRGRVPALRGE